MLVGQEYNNNNNNSGSSQKCFIGPPNQRVSNPDQVVQISGFGWMVTCGIIEMGGQTEVIAFETCATVQALVSSLCQCERTTTVTNINNKDVGGAAHLLVNNDATPPMTTIFNVAQGMPITETANPVRIMTLSLSFYCSTTTTTMPYIVLLHIIDSRTITFVPILHCLRLLLLPIVPKLVPGNNDTPVPPWCMCLCWQ